MQFKRPCSGPSNDCRKKHEYLSILPYSVDLSILGKFSAMEIKRFMIFNIDSILLFKVKNAVNDTERNIVQWNLTLWECRKKEKKKESVNLF